VLWVGHRRVDPHHRRAGQRDAAWAPAPGRPPEALDDDTAHVIAAIARADAVVLATPVYRGSLTGALKNLLDHVPVPALRATPVGIVAMGGSDHHYLGVERHLRDVLAFFGAHSLPTAVYLSSRDFADGVPGGRAAARSRAAGRTFLATPRAPKPPQRRRAGAQLDAAVDVGHVAPQPPDPGRLIGDQR
jgi:NAD(P)H-dependent FMN reductase